MFLQWQAGRGHVPGGKDAGVCLLPDRLLGILERIPSGSPISFPSCHAQFSILGGQHHAVLPHPCLVPGSDVTKPLPAPRSMTVSKREGCAEKVCSFSPCLHKEMLELCSTTFLKPCNHDSLLHYLGSVLFFQHNQLCSGLNLLFIQRLRSGCLL